MIDLNLNGSNYKNRLSSSLPGLLLASWIPSKPWACFSASLLCSSWEKLYEIEGEFRTAIQTVVLIEKDHEVKKELMAKKFVRRLEMFLLLGQSNLLSLRRHTECITQI
ncbi:PREDICTED: uncharacterized protein LOC109205169 isoform X2 [Nicotiana attenuata]|uniref:uncharacterized protein LOC109205169 isoform X2 n=1 Tax=Nicotiana attenuata TaxID=49451 RepID=UPI000904B88D|nr:PREDICTED: uncharacterized protein LOC109205169 isoform X2 [Nicotiana attenuata]